jgi:hypothetical protein
MDATVGFGPIPVGHVFAFPPLVASNNNALRNGLLTHSPPSTPVMTMINLANAKLTQLT